MKKLTKFWRIYIFAVTAFLLLSVLIYIIMAGYLSRYEVRVTEERAVKRRESEISRAADSESLALQLQAEQNEAEQQADKLISARGALEKQARLALNAAIQHVSDTVSSSPDRAMDALIASVEERGLAAAGKYLDVRIGKYEKPESVYKYADSQEGRFLYTKTSELSYKLQKGDFTADVLFEREENESGKPVYKISKISAAVPLMTYTVQAPEGAIVRANGVKVAEAPVTAPVSRPASIPKAFVLPSVSEYKLDGMIYRPSLEAVIADKDCCKKTYENKTVFLIPANSTYESALSDRLCELTYMYSDYVAGDIDFNGMKPVLYYGSDLYNRLAGFVNKWYYEYDHIQNVDPLITQFTVWSESLVSAHIEYDQQLYNAAGKKTKTIKLSLDVYIGCTGEPAVPSDSYGDWVLINVE